MGREIKRRERFYKRVARATLLGCYHCALCVLLAMIRVNEWKDRIFDRCRPKQKDIEEAVLKKTT